MADRLTLGARPSKEAASDATAAEHIATEIIDAIPRECRDEVRSAGHRNPRWVPKSPRSGTELRTEVAALPCRPCAR